MGNRTIFEIEVVDNGMRYFYNKEASQNNKSLMYLVADITALLIGNFIEDEKAINTIMEQIVVLLNNGDVMSNLEHEYRYAYREENLEGYTNGVSVTIAQIATIMHNYSRSRSDTDTSTFFKASLMFHSFCVENNIKWDKLFFLPDNEILEKYPILKDCPLDE